MSELSTVTTEVAAELHRLGWYFHMEIGKWRNRAIELTSGAHDMLFPKALQAAHSAIASRQQPVKAPIAETEPVAASVQSSAQTEAIHPANNATTGTAAPALEELNKPTAEYIPPVAQA